MTLPPIVDPLFVALQAALAGQFSLERELGRGGMGVVYLARDVALDRLVAIKLLPPAQARQAELRERFLREARLAAGLSHPNIVPIHAVAEAGGLVFFVMAYVPGETLGQRLRARGPLPAAEAARVLRDAAWALGYAHAQGVVHRDVKPDNLLLEAGGRRTLIADFGIAAPARMADGADGPRAGTVAYLSPEQATGERMDGRSDIYSLGVVAYFVLSGTLPYPVTSLHELVERQLAGPPPPLATLAPHVPRALCRAVDRCLLPLPTARYQVAEELAGALEQLAEVSTDLPPALRVWLAGAQRMRGPLLLISALYGLPLLAGLAFALASGAPGLGPVSAISTGLVTVPWLLYGGTRLMQTRRLLEVGYTHTDIVLALARQAERRREELAFEYGTQSTRMGRLLRSGVRIGAGVGAGGLLLSLLFRDAALLPASLSALVISGLLHLARRFVPGSRAGAKDGEADFAERLWRSRAGKWMTEVAGWRLTKRTAPDQLLHRPTELALGDAAAALFAALPAPLRRDLKPLPEQIRQLAAQAQGMRRKVEELDDLIAQAAPETLFGDTAASPRGDGGAAPLREARDLWAARLRETVTLLESLRLGLLKLHAGGAVPETLTADLDAAREMQQRLGHLLDAQAEVNAATARPGRPA